MIVGVLLVASIFGIVALSALLVFRRDLVGVDLGTRSLLRLYLYLASLAGVVLVVVGVAALVDWAAAQVFGVEAIYGRPGMQPGEPDFVTAMAQQNELASRMDVLRGLTLGSFGLLVWAGHRFVRSRVSDPDEETSALRRAYDVLGMFVFGAATVILLPVGVYLALSKALLAAGELAYVQGFGDSLAGGIASAPVWLVYLMRVMRAASKRPETRMPARPAPVPTGVA